jgi:hypothetical protein
VPDIALLPAPDCQSVDLTNPQQQHPPTKISYAFPRSSFAMDASNAKPPASGKGFSPLSDDLLLEIVSYLWFHDLYSTSAVDRRARSLIVDNKPIIYDLMANLFIRNGAREINPQRLKDLCGFSCTQVLRLCSRFAYWPTDIDTDLLKYNVEEVALQGQTSRCVTYTGRVLGYNRRYMLYALFSMLIVSLSLSLSLSQSLTLNLSLNLSHNRSFVGNMHFPVLSSLIYESAMAGRLRSIRSVSATAETPTVSRYLLFVSLSLLLSLNLTHPLALSQSLTLYLSLTLTLALSLAHAL